MKLFILMLSLSVISFSSFAEVTEEMKKRASEAGIIIERDHDPQRTYLANDVLAKDTIRNIQMAYYMYRAKLDEKAAELYLISAKRGYEIAQAEMGKIYLHGKGVEPDVIEAYKWFILSEDETSIRNAKILSELMTKEELEKAENLIKNFSGSYQ